jgi:hypothetical protein
LRQPREDFVVIDPACGDPLDDRHVGVRQRALQRKLVRFEEACCQELLAQAAQRLTVFVGKPPDGLCALLGGAWEPTDQLRRLRGP